MLELGQTQSQNESRIIIVTLLQNELGQFDSPLGTSFVIKHINIFQDVDTRKKEADYNKIAALRVSFLNV